MGDETEAQRMLRAQQDFQAGRGVAEPAQPRFATPPQHGGQPASGGRLTDIQWMMIEQRISNEKPSTGAAYLLCVFLGAFGIHRFYIGAKGSGIAMLILGLTFIGLIITGPWAFIDLFLIPSIIRGRVEDLRHKLMIEAMANAG